MVIVSWWNRTRQCRSILLGVICFMSKRVRTLGCDLVGFKTTFFNSLESSLKFYSYYFIVHCLHTH